MQAKVKVGFTTTIVFGTSEQDIQEQVAEMQRVKGIPCKVIYFIERPIEDSRPEYKPLPKITYSRNNRPL